VWAIKDKAIGSAFFDAVAAHFFEPKLSQTKSESTEPIKRLKYVVDGTKVHGDGLGSALGPDWSTNLSLHGTNDLKKKNVIVEHEVEVLNVFRKDELTERINQMLADQKADDAIKWPVFVELTNGKVIGCDFVVSATGVTPNTQFLTDCDTGLELADDGGIKVNNLMRTSLANIYAAGDVCSAGWDLAEHWFQMRLWTQARQMGCYAAYCIASNFDDKIDPLFHSNFEVFTHVTKFFGYKVTLLGLFNGQKLDNKYEVLYRVSGMDEYVKVVQKNGFLKGAVLIGETDLEETFENLIHNQIDLSRYGEDLLNSSVDIEDYFD
jgi:NAD(P)H-nitrite reductase large subunit